MTRIITLSAVFALCTVGCVQKATQTAQAVTSPKPPSRLLFLVFDQLRPDLIDRYQMKTFQKVRAEGLSFPNAYVGHLSSVTVVSHAVMTTGLLPKNLPWQEELFRDDGKKLGAPGLFYSVVDLESEQYLKLLRGTESTSLSRVLKEAPRPVPVETPIGSPVPNEPWGPTIAIAQKHYAAHVFGGTKTDSIVTLSSKRKETPLKGWRTPTGVAVPPFVLNPFGGKYFVDSNATFGSDNTLYPMDGFRYLPTHDTDHVGGDAWTSSLAIDYMKQNPNWRAVYASFGSIDKILHVLAEHENDTREEWAIRSGATLRKTLEHADRCLADLLGYLQESGVLNETLVVITADHGGQANTHFHGIEGKGRATFDFGKGVNFDSQQLPPGLKPALDTGLLEIASFDSMLRFWVKKTDLVSLAKFAKALKTVPGLAEIYIKKRTNKNVHYIRHFRHPDLNGEALEWAKDKNQELVESMANPAAPDVLGLLLDDHGYALKGEHGGAQRLVQAIPMIFLSPLASHRGRVLDASVRLVDLNPMILKLMNIAPPSGLDGTSAAVDGL